MYGDETHESQLNELTKRLYAEGWTRERHPDYVYWSDWQNFGFKWKHVIGLTWETSCGILIDGGSDVGRGLAVDDMSFNGIWYCPENNNPDIRCPLEKQNCSHRIAELPFLRCPCHQTQKTYSYENSVEKLIAERDNAAHEKWMNISGGQYCVCIEGNNGYSGGYFQVKYDVEKCILQDCKNEFCSILKQPNDLSRCNIFYDVRRTWITRKGFSNDKKVQIEKGVKVFGKPIARTFADIWMKKYQADNKILIPKHARDDRRMQYFTKHHRSWPNYDYFEFHYEVENVRIESVRPSRDLRQDLADISEGIEVVHSSDLIKAAKAEKKEKLEQGRVARERQRNNRIIKNLQQIISTGKQSDGSPATENMIRFAKKELKKRGIEIEKEYEQCSLFKKQ